MAEVEELMECDVGLHAGGGAYAPPPRKMCVHCLTHLAARARGLCWGCFNKIEVRLLYPTSDSIYCRRPSVDFNGPAAEPTEATDAPPGSEEKIEVLAARVAAGQSLWHPADVSWRGWEGRESRQPSGIDCRRPFRGVT